MSTNEIRAVEMVRSIRDQLLEETGQLSPDEFKTFIAREASKATQKQGKPSSSRPAA